ncbi:CD9 antigen-like [Hippoglossus hippoglossus]|uniref:CD9 antigen-like n=1 Tax=Hippoglossus hippoglossus TaxID=8267 RepID=UPI00148C7721|nr:CD9 antigen-like [Hippoglossus hippoglossus]
MGLDGCGTVCVYVIVLFNIALAVAGSAFLALGLFLRFNVNTRVVFEIASLKSWVFVMDVKIIIVLGTFMLITALFGFIGSSSKKKWALETFSGLLSFLLFSAMALLGLTFWKSDAVAMNIMEFYISMYALYDGVDPVIGTTLRIIHNLLHCCGVTGIGLIETTCPKPSGFLEHFVMPNCPEKIAGFFDRKAPLIGVLFALVFLLSVPLVCSSIICKKIRVSVSTTQYTVMTNSALPTPQPLQQGFVPTSYSYPNPDIFPLVPVVEA